MADRRPGDEPEAPSGQQPRQVKLPEPRHEGPTSVEEAIQARRSVRDFSGDALDLARVSQLLWAAQGITGRGGLRSAPSAGALYPLEVFLVAGAVEGLSSGVYRYLPREHALGLVFEEDPRQDLARAAVHQGWIGDAPAVIVLAAVYARTAGKYGERARRYVQIEVGHVGQNVYLQAEALGLGTTMVGAFHDDRVAAILRMDPDERPLGILPVGVPR